MEKNSVDDTLTRANAKVSGADGRLERRGAAGQAITVSAVENTVVLAGSKTDQVYGGQLILNRVIGAADLHAVKNSVVLINATRGSNPAFRGTYMEAHNAKGSLKIRAEENTVTAEV